MGRWHFVSSQIERLLGYTADEWRADPTLWRASLHADDRERVEFDEERHLESPPGTELVSEYRLRHRTGRSVWVRDRAVLSVDEDGERMIDGILTDITAERAAAGRRRGTHRRLSADLQQLRRDLARDRDRALPRLPEPQRRGRLPELDPAATWPPPASRSRGCSTESSATSRRSGPTCATTAAQVEAGADERGSGGAHRLAAWGCATGSAGSSTSRAAPPHTDGVGELQVGDAAYDDWDIVRDFEDLDTARAFRQVLAEQGYAAVLTSDWPLDELGPRRHLPPRPSRPGPRRRGAARVRLAGGRRPRARPRAGRRRRRCRGRG